MVVLWRRAFARTVSSSARRLLLRSSRYTTDSSRKIKREMVPKIIRKQFRGLRVRTITLLCCVLPLASYVLLLFKEILRTCFGVIFASQSQRCLGRCLHKCSMSFANNHRMVDGGWFPVSRVFGFGCFETTAFCISKIKRRFISSLFKTRNEHSEVAQLDRTPAC